MKRNKKLMEQYKDIVETPDAAPIRKSELALFEKIIDNEVKYMSEKVLSGDLATLGAIMTPVVRRAFPYIFGKDLVGIQPLTRSTGHVFSLRYYYNGNKAGNGSNRVIGGESGDALTTDYSWTPSDGTRNSSNSLVLVWSSTSARQADAPDVGYGEAPVAGTSDLAGLATVIYSEENKALVRVSGTGNTLATLKALADTSGNDITGYYDNEAAYVYVLKNYSGPISTLTAEGLGTDTQELNLNIDKQSVEAKERRLKTRFSLESLTDLRNEHGLDLDEELTEILRYELAQGINREILDTINDQATTSTYNLTTDSDGRWSKERYIGLYTELVRKANDIARTTLRGPGNFIFGSPDFVTVAETFPGFSTATKAGEPNSINTNVPVNQLGSSMMGSLGGRFNVYMDIFSSSNYATVGYKGSSTWDTGVVYSPYVMADIKQTTNSESLEQALIIQSRDAIVATPFSADRFYRKITLSNLF